jgi:hypothetical protein
VYFIAGYFPEREVALDAPRAENKEKRKMTTNFSTPTPAPWEITTISV